MVFMMGDKGVMLIVLLILCSLLVAFPIIETVRATEESWVLKAPMPLSSWGVAVVNGKIYAIGTNDVAEYDPEVDAWTFKKPMPTNRTSFALAVYHDKIHVIGGSKGLNQLYDPATDTWEPKASMPTPRTQLEANVVNDKIYLIGGRTGGPDSTVGLNEVYDPATDTWSTGAPIPVPVDSYASAVVDNKIYVIGGEGPKPPDLNQIYDPETNTWSHGATIPNGVVDAAAGATSGVLASKRIYVLGGRINYDIWGTDINQIYNPENDSWTTGASMPIARAWLHVAVVNDMIYAMGGAPYFNLQGTWSPENYQYTPSGYIPEFPSWVILPLVLIVTLGVLFLKKRLITTSIS